MASNVPPFFGEPRKPDYGFILGKTVAAVAEPLENEWGWPEVVVTFTDGSRVAVTAQCDWNGDCLEIDWVEPSV